jgi:hypothetical protein
MNKPSELLDVDHRQPADNHQSPTPFLQPLAAAQAENPAQSKTLA